MQMLTPNVGEVSGRKHLSRSLSVGLQPLQVLSPHIRKAEDGDYIGSDGWKSYQTPPNDLDIIHQSAVLRDPEDSMKLLP